LAVFVGLYGLVLAVPLLRNAVFKLGLMHDLGGRRARMVAVWRETEWWQLALWLAAVGLFLTAALRLIRGRSALAIFAVAFAADAGLWWMLRSSASYSQAFTVIEQRSDYYTLAIMLLVGGLIWVIERAAARTAAP
jgi:hypothetical protein